VNFLIEQMYLYIMQEFNGFDTFFIYADKEKKKFLSVSNIREFLEDYKITYSQRQVQDLNKLLDIKNDKIFFQTFRNIF